jgi:hypothetical protein
MIRDAKKHKIRVFQIGEVLNGSGKVIYEKRGIQKLVKNEGFVHFAR